MKGDLEGPFEKGGSAMMVGWDMTAWGWFWMLLTMGGGTLLLVLVIVLLTRGTTASAHRDQPEEPRDILARRFARGEIDEAEYRRRLDALKPGT